MINSNLNNQSNLVCQQGGGEVLTHLRKQGV